MNRKAILKSTVAYFIITLALTAGLGYFIWDQMNSASSWSDHYIKELTKTINLAEAPQTISLDVQRLTEIALKNNIPPARFDEIFTNGPEENEICIKLSLGRKNCYRYFNNVEVEFEGIKHTPVNTIVFNIKEKEND